MDRERRLKKLEGGPGRAEAARQHCVNWLMLKKSSTIGCLAIIKAFCMYIYGEKEMALDTVLHNTGIAIAN